MSERCVHNPANDPVFNKPYVDIREERVRCGISYTYVHGGFSESDLRFSLYFPAKEAYENRFFHYLPPAANHEDASQSLTGGDDKITFALSHGAYFVESNLATLNPFAPGASDDITIPYRTSSAVAEYSRAIAREIYGNEIPRPYGYLFGGSGGAYKTISCVENCDSWDGCVPYVNGAPVSVPHHLTIRAHGLRTLRHKIPDIIAALEPGGSGDMYENLTADEAASLDELLAFGFPKGAMASLVSSKDGALPILMGGIMRGDPEYFADFWKEKGYAGSDPNSDASRARICHKTRITGKFVPARSDSGSMDNTTGVDTNWQRYKGLSGALGDPLIQVESMPEPGFLLLGCFVNVLTGKAAGKKVYFDAVQDNVLRVAEYFGCEDMMDVMAEIEPGDEVLLDNSNYIAATDYHLHALPHDHYDGFDICYNADGTPKYVQRDHVVNFTGASRQSGDFRCKMIIEHAYCDEMAYPYPAEWYRRQAIKSQGEKEARSRLRVQFIDNALHDDRAEPVGVELQYVTNCAAIFQCLLDVANWVENGVEPPQESVYTLRSSEIIPAEGIARGGIQSIIRLHSHGSRRIAAKAGETVYFTVDALLPEGAGKITRVEWSFEGEKDYPVKTGDCLAASHTFANPGKYTVCVRTYNHRSGDEKDVFTQIPNIDRMLVEVI